MNESINKPINIVSVIISIFLPIVFILGSFSEVLSLFGKTVFYILFLLLYALITTVAYWGGIIQGIRSIANGRYKTRMSACIFRLINYVSHMLIAVMVSILIRHSSNGGARRFFFVLMIIFLIMSLLIIIRLNMMKGMVDANVSTEGSGKTAVLIVLFCFVVPIVLIVITVLVYKFIEANPMVAKVLGIVAAILYMLVIIGIVRFGASIIGKFVPGDDGMSESGGGIDNSHKNASGVNKKTAKPSVDKQAIINELNDRYAREYKMITNSSPAMLDYKIIKDGPMLDAVKNLRTRYQQEAKKKGVYGKTKWF